MKKFVIFLMVFSVLASAVVTTVPAEEISAVAYGDCTGDGCVTLADASMMLKHIAGWNVTVDTLAADINLDGQVTLFDVSGILQRLAGWPVALGPRREIPGFGEDVFFDEADFGEDEFRVIHYGSKASEYKTDYITGDSLAGDDISYSVAARNQEVEEFYNVKIVAEECDSPAREATIRQQAGQCDFELMSEWGIRSVGLALDGFFYDYNELDEYLNLDRSYWFPDAAEGLSVCGRLYLMPAAMSLDALANGEMLCFNKDHMDRLNFAWPYEYVYADCWTYDVMLSMAAAAEDGVNGGGVSGEVILAGACRDIITKANPDGTYEFVPYTERMVDMYNKFYARASKLSAPAGDAVAAFRDGRTMFLHGCLDDTKKLSDMRDDYGIVPMPTAVAGEDFVSAADHQAPIFSIPIQVWDPEMTATVLEYMAYKSEKLLLPALIETTLKTKRMEDTRDYDMLDFIRDGLDFRFEELYLHDSTLSDIRGMMLKTGNFASASKRYGAKCQSEIDEVVERVMAHER